MEDMFITWDNYELPLEEAQSIVNALARLWSENNRVFNQLYYVGRYHEGELDEKAKRVLLEYELLCEDGSIPQEVEICMLFKVNWDGQQYRVNTKIDFPEDEGYLTTAKVVLKKYLRFFHYGENDAESHVLECPHREPHLVKVPKGAYAFEFFDHEIVTYGFNNRTAVGPDLNVSPRYFVEGRMYSRDDLEELSPVMDGYLAEMEDGNVGHIILLPPGGGRVLVRDRSKFRMLTQDI